ncbi:MAG: metal ABC transporter permease, partial [Klebsiella pneumoniae]|nr:metal ABC transporter permease [Klebsiella pneumoniae]
AALLLFSVIFALFITYIKSKSRTSTDTIIGVCSSTAIAVGLMVMSYGGGFSKFSSYLIGDLLSISPTEIGALIIVDMLVFFVWGVIFNRLLIISINSSFAASRGINTLWIEMAFASMLAIVVAISIQWVGLLIINSMLVLPAAAARNITNTVKQYHAVSIAIAVFSGIAGLIVSYYCNMATGATIVVISAAVFFFTLLLKSYFVR